MSNCKCVEIMTADTNRHFKGCPLRKEMYEAPKLVQLRLEEKVAKAADKWWKVEDWINSELNTLNKDGLPAYAFWDFIVRLLKEQ